MLAAGDAAESRQRFSLTSRHQEQGFAIGQIVDLLNRHKQIIGRAHVAKFASFGDHIEHRAAQQTHLAAVLERQLKNHGHPMDRTGKGGDDHPALRLRHAAIEIGKHRTLWRTETRYLGVGGVAEETEHTLITVMCQAGDVEVLTIHRGVIKFEITGENHRAHRSGDSQRKAIRHRVGVADELHREVLTHLDHVPRTHGLQGGAIGNASLIHLAGEHRQSQTRPINHRNVEVLEVMGNATDVILMTMGDDHSPDALLVLPQKARIREHDIDTVHAIAGKSQTSVNEHQIISVLEHTGVLADLMQTTKGNHPQAGLVCCGLAIT